MLKLFGRPSDDDSCIDTYTRVKPHVRILNGILDESGDSSSPLMLHGKLDPATIHQINVGEYQRPLGERSDIYQALKDGLILPSVEIGVRGQHFDTEGDNFVIESPCFVIDGWQRIGTARKLLEQIPNFPLRIFASIHFATDEIWERHRFAALNKNTRRVSPNLHLKNIRDSNPAIMSLLEISEDRAFPLFKKISWSQNMQKGELISAVSFAYVVQILHSHRSPIHGRDVDGTSASLAKLINRTTAPTFRKNTFTFFGIVDECWPFAAIEYRHRAPQVKMTFLTELARMFSCHQVFWEHNDNTLTVSADDRRKLAKFRINDPTVMQLAGTGGAARKMLYQLLVDHMNSGRRTQRLRSRYDEMEQG